MFPFCCWCSGSGSKKVQCRSLAALLFNVLLHFESHSESTEGSRSRDYSNFDGDHGPCRHLPWSTLPLGQVAHQWHKGLQLQLSSTVQQMYPVHRR